MNKKLENLEKKLGIATSLVQELTVEVEELPVAVIEETEANQVFSIETLKTDFFLARNSLIKLIATGQRVLDTASVIDVSDMKASQLTALSEMQSKIGGNIKLLMDCYKIIVEIEKLRQKDAKVLQAPSNVNMGQVTTNNIMFSGSSEELLTMIRDNQNQ